MTHLLDITHKRCSPHLPSNGGKQKVLTVTLLNPIPSPPTRDTYSISDHQRSARLPSRFVIYALYPRTIKVHENKSWYQTMRLSVPSALYPVHLRIRIYFLDQIPWLQHLKRAAHSAFLFQAALLSSCPRPIFLNAHYYLSRSALSPGCYYYLPGFTMLRQAPIVVFWVI